MRFIDLRRSCAFFLIAALSVALGCNGSPDIEGVSGAILPNSSLTPGDVLPVDCSEICRYGYAESARDVPLSLKREVYREYGITQHAPGQFEVDHLISLELGGSNSIKNLWPESYETQPWNAHVKDQLENLLHDMSCSRKLSLATAQHAISTDWVAAYKTYFHTDTPLSEEDAKRYCEQYWHGEPHQTAVYTRENVGGARAVETGSSGDVWVNTRSGKFFEPGSQYYGRTEVGKYMSESSALAAGYVRAKSYYRASDMRN